MRWLPMFFLAVASLAPPRTAWAQTAADTLPERVVARAYDALNRCDDVAFYSLFAPVWYHSIMEDSSRVARRWTRESASGANPQMWTGCGDKPRFKMIRRIVRGPYVVDEQVAQYVGVVHLDIFEVRHGKIVHEWESNDYAGWGSAPSPH